MVLLLWFERCLRNVKNEAETDQDLKTRSCEILPKCAFYHRGRAWLLMLLCTQAVLGAASWLGMRSNRFWYIYSATQKSHSNAFDNDLAVSQQL